MVPMAAGFPERHAIPTMPTMLTPTPPTTLISGLNLAPTHTNPGASPGIDPCVGYQVTR